jgi:pimeloyl-ACP methyl ester carboxylesterase
MTCAAALLAGTACATSGSQLTRLAAGHSVATAVVQGDGFRHRLIANAAAQGTGGTLLVFIEGDGRPWSAGGSTPSRDPTARKPLAFELFLRTTLPSWYVTRPCYEQLMDAACTPALWTSARYSRVVIDSMAAAVRASLARDDHRAIVLVGYSGGGVIATLLAERLPRVRGVVTIAANLDVAAWTRLHGYEPLAESMDPAREPSTVAHVALVGERDTNVPPSSISAWVETHPGAVLMPQDAFDHVCCWARDWEALLDQALARLAVRAISRN